MSEITAEEISSSLAEKSGEEALFYEAVVAENKVCKKTNRDGDKTWFVYAVTVALASGRHSGKTATCELSLDDYFYKTQEKLEKVFGWVGSLKDIRNADFVGRKCRAVLSLKDGKYVRCALAAPSIRRKAEAASDAEWNAFLKGQEIGLVAPPVAKTHPPFDDETPF